MIDMAIITIDVSIASGPTVRVEADLPYGVDANQMVTVAHDLIAALPVRQVQIVSDSAGIGSAFVARLRETFDRKTVETMHRGKTVAVLEKRLVGGNRTP